MQPCGESLLAEPQNESVILRSLDRERRPFLPIFVFFALLLWSVPTPAIDELYVIDDFRGVNVTVSDPDTVKVDVVNSKLAVSVRCSETKQRIVHIPLQRSAKDQKIRLTIADVNSLSYMGKSKSDIFGRAIPRSQEHIYLDYQKGPIFFSLSNKYHEYLSVYFHCRRLAPDVTGVVYIDKIEIVPLEFTDDRDFAYILAVLLLALFLVPGFFAYGLLFDNGKKESLLALLTPLSILSFLILYFILIANQKLSSTPSSWVLLWAYIVLNAFLIIGLGIKKRLTVLASNIQLIRFEILALFIVIFCVAAIVTKNLDLPLHTFAYDQLRYLTYGAFGAHDPVFQYVNGIAIFHDEPFSKYYGHSKLIYTVQDRGIIVGVIYAVIRGIAAPFNVDIAYSFGLYTLFGSGLNTLVLLPVFALHKYFFPSKERPLLILFLVSASAFFVTNYFITWYKLAGAGLVISGIVLLLVDKNSIKQWILVGVVWGLATNVHPSLALTFPIVTVWLLFRFWQANRRRILPVLWAFLALVGSFMVVNLPWAVVKETHYQDTNKLFRQHFLASQRYDREHGIIGSIKNFANKHTLEHQISERYKRLEASLRTKEIKSLIESTANAPWNKVLIAWNALEASYIVFVFLPLIVLLAISSGITRLLPAATWSKPLTNHAIDFRWLLITQVLNIFLILIGSFGSLSPDITWHIPMSCLVIVIYLLVHRNIAVGRIGATLIVVYSLFTYYRLFFQYF